MGKRKGANEIETPRAGCTGQRVNKYIEKVVMKSTTLYAEF